MGRRRKGPWLRDFDRCWYTTIGRKSYKLGTVEQPYTEIEQAYAKVIAELLAGRTITPSNLTKKPPANPVGITVAALATKYEQHAKDYSRQGREAGQHGPRGPRREHAHASARSRPNDISDRPSKAPRSCDTFSNHR